MPPKLEAVRDWFTFAQTDLQTAQYLLQRAPPFLRQACLHMQQAIEKSLKGVLLLNDQRPPRTHSLADLIGLCERWIPGLSQRAKSVEWLTAYAEDERYPGAVQMIEPETARQGFATVQAILEFIHSAMPPEVRQ